MVIRRPYRPALLRGHRKARHIKALTTEVMTSSVRAYSA
ncbi:hypothetical protein PRUB_a2358 [Pseudoalteromonas rubra]|uniref:Uncharacterized protein n=1 Tax=Pseudoalteromonas rubra TaxID=43658 RepID=A0A8T0CCV4_9GAMM|nr:hypothetical protein PRUB_a2358 [Pseudoalteromonas rubra]